LIWLVIAVPAPLKAAGRIRAARFTRHGGSQLFRGAIYLAVMLIADIGILQRPAVAAREFYSGNQIYEFCTTVAEQTACFAYVMAIADAMADGNKVSGWSACIPIEVTGQQAVDIVVQSFRRNVATRHYGAASLIARALSEAFPCR
jgi:hypothetical protein